MPMLTIKLDGDGALREFMDGVSGIHHVRDAVEVTALDGGMSSGAPSVAIAAKLEDGSGVIIETSLALFLTAADAFRARHGDPRNQKPGAPDANPVH